MPSVDELLDAAEVAEVTLTETNDKIEIDADTRTMIIPDTERIFGVMSDEKGERKYFRCKRFVGNGIDLSKLSLRVVFQNASGLDTGRDKYIVTDLATDGEDYVTFSWELSRKVTAYKGIISFIVCAIKTKSDGTITNEWNTTLANGIVLEGLEANGTQEQEEVAKDYYNQLEAELEKKAQEVIKTIPSDYTQMQKDVDSLKEDIGDFPTESLIPYTKIENKMVDRYNARYDNTNYDLIVVQDLSQYIGMQILFTFSAADSAAYTISTNEYEKILEHGTPEEIISDYEAGTYISTTIKVNVTEQMKILQISFAKNKNPRFSLVVWNSVRGEIQKIGQFETPEMYGAKGDGVTDDSGAFQRMLNHCEKPILLGAKEYKISTGLIDTTGHVFCRIQAL